MTIQNVNHSISNTCQSNRLICYSGRPVRQLKHQCNYCPKKFAAISNLLLHEVAHRLKLFEPKKVTQQKQYFTDLNRSLGKQLSRKMSSLEYGTTNGTQTTNESQRAASDLGKQIVACHLCSMRFGSNSLLKSHERIHEWVQSLGHHQPFETKLIFRSVVLEPEDSDWDSDSIKEPILTQEDLIEFDSTVCIAEQEGHKEMNQTKIKKQEAKTSRIEQSNKIRPKTSNKRNANKISIDGKATIANHHAEGRYHLKKKAKYECEECNQVFNVQYLFDEHKKIHISKRTFRCNLCNKTFNCAQHRDRHVLIHTGQRPFKCRHCSKRFNRSDNRNTHERLHKKK